MRFPQIATVRRVALPWNVGRAHTSNGARHKSMDTRWKPKAPRRLIGFHFRSAHSVCYRKTVQPSQLDVIVDQVKNHHNKPTQWRQRWRRPGKWVCFWVAQSVASLKRTGASITSGVNVSMRVRVLWCAECVQYRTGLGGNLIIRCDVRHIIIMRCWIHKHAMYIATPACGGSVRF